MCEPLSGSSRTCTRMQLPTASCAPGMQHAVHQTPPIALAHAMPWSAQVPKGMTEKWGVRTKGSAWAC